MFFVRYGGTYYNCDQIVKIDESLTTYSWKKEYIVTFSNGDTAEFTEETVEYILKNRNENK